ncbi:hypothetical protein NDU88_000588 [Pleurodeles waltl]|uniref:Uncharacterized protein n=1 Tax=Pleurodeles waltl TaxID=8319 RepID=A0AAV7WFY1_PLEWA|nr:hypothetical protein NDU88_000588 [Pleurodeles waltl]
MAIGGQLTTMQETRSDLQQLPHVLPEARVQTKQGTGGPWGCPAQAALFRAAAQAPSHKCSSGCRKSIAAHHLAAGNKIIWYSQLHCNSTAQKQQEPVDSGVPETKAVRSYHTGWAATLQLEVLGQPPLALLLYSRPRGVRVQLHQARSPFKDSPHPRCLQASPQVTPARPQPRSTPPGTGHRLRTDTRTGRQARAPDQRANPDVPDWLTLSRRLARAVILWPAPPPSSSASPPDSWIGNNVKQRQTAPLSAIPQQPGSVNLS